MKRTLFLLFLLCVCISIIAQIPFGKGHLTVTKVARNAVRVQYTTDEAKVNDLPDWLYVKHGEVESNDISYQVDTEHDGTKID